MSLNSLTAPGRNEPSCGKIVKGDFVADKGRSSGGGGERPIKIYPYLVLHK